MKYATAITDAAAYSTVFLIGHLNSVHGAEQRLDRSRGNIAVDADAIEFFAVAGFALDIGSRLSVLAGTQRMFAIVDYFQRYAQRRGHGVNHTGNQAISTTADRNFAIGSLDLADENTLAAGCPLVIVDQAVFPAAINMVALLERRPDVLG